MDSRLTGYAARFDSPTDIAGLFTEVVRKGAFREAIRRDDTRALFNHDANHILGRTKSGTLTLTEDEQGLRYDVTLPNTTWARDLYTSIKRGDVSQSSFAFRADQEVWVQGPKPLRELLAVQLFDVSPVTFPAYEDTNVSARAGSVELRGAGIEGRSIADNVDALGRLRLLTAALSACEQCRVGVATRLVGTREGRRMRFSSVCVACSNRLHPDRRARVVLRRDDRALTLREREFKLLYS